MLTLLVACLVLVFVLAGFALLALVGLITVGVVSTSVFIGVHQRSATKGFLAFTLTTFAVIGCALGCASGEILYRILHQGTVATSLLLGAFVGLIAGILFGRIAFRLLQRFITYLRQKLTSS
ncbi:hypothetical protein SAMN05421823_101586 [Catalinimonas alkaloidigena]|uniref:Uncharacterized protein n=2 Tax=Catalinimonas alkaloidigena TaxID=1075417 RepID=A0A1G8Y773_9BACT|nr:hypothetical protein SAMN05421823_101586 [Catalinimonas alkaloidigena]